jgi:hypothetical protein
LSTIKIEEERSGPTTAKASFSQGKQTFSIINYLIKFYDTKLAFAIDFS